MRVVHELALMESVVEAITDQIGALRVTTVRLEIGQLAGVELEALRFCFEVCTRETSLAEATLEIRPIPASAHCNSCGAVHALASLVSPCVCGSFDRELLTGTELRLKDVEVV